MLDEIRPGLFRWTANHPAAVEGAEPESADDWPAEVGCVAYRAPDALVLIDPLVPDELWPELDVLAAAVPRVVVLTTIRFHGRSRDAVIDRYGATTPTDPPPGVRPIPIARADETMFLIEEHAALVPGDRLMGDGRGGLRMCPESWLSYLPELGGTEGLRDSLRPLLDLPIEIVLVSHREPVLEDGRAAIERALA